MKIILTVFSLLTISILFAQIPAINFKDFELKNKVEKVEISTFSFKDKMVEETLKETLLFNSEGNIVEKQSQIFGKYGSITLYKYQYENNRLSKVVKEVPSAPSFNEVSTFKYNENNLVSEVKVASLYYNSTYNFFYDNNKVLQKVLGNHKEGKSEKNYFYTNGNLFKTIETRNFNDDVVKTTEIYKEKNVVLSFQDSDNFIVVHLISDKFKREINLFFDENTIENKFVEIENHLKGNNKFEDYKSYIESFENYKIVIDSKYKLGENNNWISSYSHENIFFENENWSFRKLILNNSRTIGSTEFNIFDVNELKKTLKLK